MLPLQRYPYGGRPPLDGEEQYQQRKLLTHPSLGTGLKSSRDPRPTAAQAPVDQSPAGPWGALSTLLRVDSAQRSVWGDWEVGSVPGGPTEAGSRPNCLCGHEA